MDYHYFTTDTLPDFLKVTEIFGIVSTSTQTKMNKGGFFEMFQKDQKENIYSKLRDSGRELSKGKANLLYGIRLSTTTLQDSHDVYLHTTIMATVGYAENISMNNNQL